MTVPGLLSRHARQSARARAAVLASRVGLAGACLAALMLLAERMGAGLPFLWMPAPPSGAEFLDVAFGLLWFSLAGLAQGIAMLGVVVVAAAGVRWLGAFLLRRGGRRTARDLDRLLSTDRYSAALEASGPLAPAVVRRVIALHPARDALPLPRPKRRTRWFTIAAVVLLLLVALSPGTAGGGEGPAPVAGAPGAGSRDHPLDLRLVGANRIFGPDEPVPVDVVAEAAFAPQADLVLPVRLSIDDGEEMDTGRQLFLPAGAPGHDFATLDLRGIAPSLAPGEHRAVAHAGRLSSNPYVFRIEAPEGGGDGAGPSPDPAATPPPPGGEDSGGRRPEWLPRFVEPLVREGEMVSKRARVPIEVPGGGAPAEKPLEEVWPELERRKEAALNRPGLSPHARELVRDYFERLRPRER